MSILRSSILSLGLLILGPNVPAIAQEVRHANAAQEHVNVSWLFLFAAVGLIAAFATTILGVVAIGQIRRSAGKLYGLPLAVYDALVFPLLVLDGLILAVVIAVQLAVLTAGVGPTGGQTAVSTLGALATVVIGLVIIALVDYLIVRAVWRGVTGYVPPPKPVIAPNAPSATLPMEAPTSIVRSVGARPRIPVAFALKAMLLAALAWSLVPLLWNAREIGIAIAACAVAAVTVYTGRRAEQFLPRTAAFWRERRALYRGASLIAGFLCAAAAVYFLFFASAQTWDRIKWNYMARSPEEFRQRNQGAEHRLLQQLGRFRKDPPRAELNQTIFGSSGGWMIGFNTPPSLGYFTLLGICATFLFGLMMLWCAYQALLRDDSNPLRCGWNTFGTAALQLTFLTLLPAGVFASVLLYLPIQAGIRGTLAPSCVTDQDMGSVVERLDAWATKHGFVDDHPHTWQVDCIPQGGVLARVEVRHYWKPNVFDRWRMTWHGLQCAAPDIAVEIIGDAARNETFFQLVAWARTSDDAESKGVGAQLDSLQEALKDLAPLPGSKPFEVTVIGTGAVSEHLKLGGGFLYLTPDQPGVGWATVQAFDQPAKPAFLMLVRHGRYMPQGTSSTGFPQKAWTTLDEGRFQQTLKVGGCTVDVDYTMKLNRDRNAIDHEFLKVDSRKFKSWQSSIPLGNVRLVTIDLTVNPAEVRLWQVNLPAELVQIKTAEQLRARTPEILELLRKEPDAAKFLGVEK